MPQFDSTTFASQIFWLVICFFFLILAMIKYILPRLDLTIETRIKKIQQDYENTEDLQAKIDQLNDENKKNLMKAHREANELVHFNLRELERLKTEKLQELSVKMSHFQHEIQAQFLSQKQQIEQDIQSIISNTVMNIFPKILDAPISIDEINAAINEVTKNQQASSNDLS